MAPRLSRSFYSQPVLRVAEACIGKILVHDTPEGLVAGRIVEAEAYRGPQDAAAHSRGGRRTPRTEAMFGEAGRAYVFMIYGIHYHFNLVAGGVGEPHAVLIRAAEPLAGLDIMRRRRGPAGRGLNVTNGPGKLCQAFGIEAKDYASDLCAGPLYLAEAAPTEILRSPRIGVDYAGSWARKLWRFSEAENPYVSVPPRATLRRK